MFTVLKKYLYFATTTKEQRLQAQAQKKREEYFKYIQQQSYAYLRNR